MKRMDEYYFYDPIKNERVQMVLNGYCNGTPVWIEGKRTPLSETMRRMRDSLMRLKGWL